MKSYISSGYICQKTDGIIYFVAKITYFYYEDETYKYEFVPNYPVIDMMGNIFTGIPGLNLDLRKPIYIRENINPVFISERVPSKNRTDLYELLALSNLTYIEPIKYLINTPLQYFGDTLCVKECYEKETKEYYIGDRLGNSYKVIKQIIQDLAYGHDVILDGYKITDENRLSVYKSLYFLYRRSFNFIKDNQLASINELKEKHMYKGRKSKPYSPILFRELCEKVDNKNITAKEASKELNMSIDKFYRLRRKRKQNPDLF